ncbi:transporter [Pseudomonas sp. MAFF212428]|uniref:Transporter n=1 Tax=Pseudomonas brassicae TaxID=2708063 RepID=A0A6B3NVG2_9PSED|nr:transporter [Pseudomonas brassicae]NER59047.1 transporter [Pseudomonas brassicae]NER66119.1 transporter [Pseudomonas brassicae]
MKQFRYLMLAAAVPSLSAHAVEVAPGDYEILPVGATVGLLYYQHSTTDSAYAQGHKASSDFNLTSNVGILRLLHVYQLTERLTISPQFLLPFGGVSSGGDASALGDTSGVGDLTVTAPLKYRLNEANDTVGATVYITAPTGNYDRKNALNLGENRWKVDLQSAYIKHFGEKWAVDLVGDAIWYSDNDDFTTNSVRREQDVSYAAQLMGRYIIDPGTSLAVGFGHTWGGETQVAGTAQDDRGETTNLRVTATKFFTAQDQLQMQLGRDLAVENGPKENFRLNLRYARVF